MTCYRCSDDLHEVIRTERNKTADGARSAHCDVRSYRCLTCGLVTFVECRPVLVEVFDPATLAVSRVAPPDYTEKWLPDQLVRRNRRSGGLFEEGGDA